MTLPLEWTQAPPQLLALFHRRGNLSPRPTGPGRGGRGWLGRAPLQGRLCGTLCRDLELPVLSQRPGSAAVCLAECVCSCTQWVCAPKAPEPPFQPSCETHLMSSGMRGGETGHLGPPTRRDAWYTYVHTLTQKHPQPSQNPMTHAGAPPAAQDPHWDLHLPNPFFCCQMLSKPPPPRWE